MLAAYGIKKDILLEWIKCFLMNRYQRVVLNGIPFLSGQGSTVVFPRDQFWGPYSLTFMSMTYHLCQTGCSPIWFYWMVLHRIFYHNYFLFSKLAPPHLATSSTTGAAVCHLRYCIILQYWLFPETRISVNIFTIIIVFHLYDIYNVRI